MSKVEVSVIDGKVTVDRENLSMVGKGRNARIHWKLTTPGWSFPADGIVIDDNEGEFTKLEPAEQGKKFWCVDRNSDGKAYKYTINVSDGKTRLTLDPVIQNEA